MTKLYDSLTKNGAKVLFFIGAIIFYLVLLFGSQDNDMFFEITSGRDLLNGNFKTASHLNDFPMIVQQWLYSACLAIFDKLGYAGHMLFVFIQDVILWIVSGLFIYRKTKNKYISIVAPIVITLGCYDYLVNIRPQIITMILLVTEILLLDKYHEKNENKYLIAMIPLLILAANFHQGLFLYHIFILIPYYFYENYKIDWKLVLVTPAFMCCSLLTPYGLRGSLYILRTFNSGAYSLFNINELKCLNILSISGAKIIFMLAVAIMLIHWQSSDRYTNFYTFSVAFLCFTATRHLSIAFIPLMFLTTKINFNKFDKYNTAIYSIVASLCFIGTIANIRQAGDLRNTYGDVANVIEDKNATIYNSAMDVGGYLEYNGYTKVRIDSRCEAFSKEISGEDNILENIYITMTGFIPKEKNKPAVLATKEEMLKIIEDYDYLVSNSVDGVLMSVQDSWIKIYEDDEYVIWKNPN